VLYALAGFFVVPPILRPKIVETLSDQTGCTVAVGNLRVNPFALSITVEDFALLDHGRAPIIAFKELYVNFEMSSIFRRACTFSEIRLVSPNIFVGIDPAGRINLEDIRRDTAAKADSAGQTPLRVVIQELAIDSGRVVFEDLARTIPFRAQFDSVGLSLKGFTTLPNEAGEYQFEATTGRNELIRWKGSVSVVPLRSAGSFDLKNIRMRKFWEYLQDRVNFVASTGSADFHSEYVFDLSKDPPPVKAGMCADEFPPQQRSGVNRLYEETFKEDPEKLLLPLPPGTERTDDEEELIVARAAFARLVQVRSVSQEELRALAGKRADAVKSVLVLKRGIGEERVFLAGINTDAPAKDGLVQMELALQAQ